MKVHFDVRRPLVTKGFFKQRTEPGPSRLYFKVDLSEEEKYLIELLDRQRIFFECPDWAKMGKAHLIQLSWFLDSTSEIEFAVYRHYDMEDEDPVKIDQLRKSLEAACHSLKAAMELVKKPKKTELDI